MKPENKQFLDDNRHHYEIWLRAKYIKHLSQQTRDQFQKVIREEFNPAYHTSLWCQQCVAEMIVYAYQEYDKMLPHVEFYTETQKKETKFRRRKK